MNKKLSITLNIGLLSLLFFVTGPVEAYTFRSNLNIFGGDTSYYYGENDYYPDEWDKQPIPTEPKQPTVQLPVYANQKGTYTVQWGDTLWLISQKLGVSLTSLRQINNKWNEAIYPGEVLYYDKSTNQPSNQFNNQSYKTALTQSDIDLMARTVYAESRGEPYKGQVAVAAVILNRLKNSNFPKTVHEVVYQPWAFSSTIDGQIYYTPNSTAYKAVYDAINGYDPSYGALYFYNPVTSTNAWIFSRQQTIKIGNHIFAI